MANTSDLMSHFVRATEEAAIAASKWRGRGDGKLADGAAVEAMRGVFDSVPFDGRVAIGEGERDDAPMLWIGEPLGSMQGVEGALKIDIAVDPLECTNHVAKDLPNAIAALDKSVTDLRVVVMDRDRHRDLIKSLRELGVSVPLIGDGDVAAALDAANPHSDVDLLMGIGAAPEGVITATALRGLDAHFEGRLVTTNEDHERRAHDMLGDDVYRLWGRDDLCASSDALFVASGVCSGYLPGVEDLGSRVAVHSEVIDVASKTRQFISAEYVK